MLTKREIRCNTKLRSASLKEEEARLIEYSKNYILKKIQNIKRVSKYPELANDFFSYFIYNLKKWSPVISKSKNNEGEFEIDFMTIVEIENHWDKFLEEGISKLELVHKHRPLLVKVATECSMLYSKKYTTLHNVPDLSGEMYCLAMKRLGRNWFPPIDSVEDIKKSFGKYLSLSFKHVLKSYWNDGIIPNYSRKGETVTPIKNFEEGFPEWIDIKEEDNGRKSFASLFALLKDELEPVDIALITLSSQVGVGKISLQGMADWMNSTEGFKHLGMTKARVNLRLKKARTRAAKIINEAGLR